MTYEAVMEELLSAAPGFAPRRATFVKQWQDEEFLPLYIGMAELGHYLVESYAAKTTQEFGPLFAAIERQLLAGDSELANLIVVGLFEVIQNVASHQPFGYEVFERWLGPESLVRWRDIDQYMRQVAEWAEHNPPPDSPSLDPETALEQVKDPQLRRFILGDFRKRS